MARPTKLNPTTQERICQAIRVGATYQLAAQYGGVTYKTFNEWMKAGEDAQKGIYREFCEAVKKAEADAAMRWLALIDQAATMQWQAAAWKLERRYPEDYGRQVKDTRLSGSVDVRTLTDEQLQQIVADKSGG